MSEDSNNSKKPKGFSGLSSLVSDIDDIKKMKPVVNNKPDSGSSKTNSPNKNTSQSTRPIETKHQTSQNTKKIHPNNPDNSSSYSWIWIVLVVIVGIIIANSDNKTSSKTRYTDTYSQDTNTYKKPPTSVPKRPTESKPSIGRNQVLNTSKIRYCLAEKIRLDGAESAINNYSQYDVNRFNSMVSDYNSRCGEFRYRSGALGRAERDIKPFRSHYLNEGKKRFVKINNKKPKSKPNPTVRSIQESLNKLGYSAGPADGYMGKKTRTAIIAYQSNSNIVQTGIASKNLLTSLELDLLIKKM